MLLVTKTFSSREKCFMTTTALSRVGNFEQLRQQFMSAAANYTYLDFGLYGNRTCGFPPENSFHIFRSADDPNFPWPGMVFGLTILALNAWCTDQVTVSLFWLLFQVWKNLLDRSRLSKYNPRQNSLLD